ncbi:MAG: HEAT repeat domain-containing protein [Planctomycetes bacterium]|nr:HEAT repeat domain-containing protein [Planctomycetota bacterium]
MTASVVDRDSENRLEKTGYLLCQSVFHTKQTGAELSRIKAVRVYQGQPFTLRAVRHGLVHLGVEAIELGTVPLAPDGSFHVEVPADRALAIQAVDAEGRGVINELSWIYVRPGERRTCVGCHSPRSSTPRLQGGAMAARSRPVSLLGQGDAHRYRGNNGANGGVLNMQFDRFREAASIDLLTQEPLPLERCETALPPGRASEVGRLCRQLTDGDPNRRLSAARRLAIFRDRAAVGALLGALGDASPDVRGGAAMALSACGNRDAVDGLLAALADVHPQVAQAANVAVENLTGHAVGFNAYDARQQADGLAAWRRWRADCDWTKVEAQLIARLAAEDPVVVHKAVEALGHVAGLPGRRALREFLVADPGRPLRTAEAAIRGLGHLGDEQAVDLLSEMLAVNMDKDPPPASSAATHLHELGWQQKSVYLAAAAAESLGRIATPDAQRTLLDALPKLRDFWLYTHWSGDHDWLRGCHSSLIHYRVIEALDALGACCPRETLPAILRSVPIDPDRALLLESDAYETLVARSVQRSGHAMAVIETCLAVLGDSEVEPADDLLSAVQSSPPAREVHPMAATSRAAQIVSVVCLDTRYADQIRAALNRYRAEPPSRQRSWVCFYLARVLGKIRDRQSVPCLLAAINDDPDEASFGFEKPPHVFVYKAMTPFYRAAAAHALGRIGDPAVVPDLLTTVADFDNAIGVRHSAALALGMLAEGRWLPQLKALAQTYPEVATRRALLEACRKAESAGAR